MRCPSCEADADTRFCGSCGERLTSPARPLTELLTDAVEVVTDVDGRIWRSLRALVGRPGALSAEYARGVRVPYMRPLQLFVVANVIYFLFTLFSTFNTPLQVHIWSENFPHQVVASELVKQRVAPELGDAEFRHVRLAAVGRYSEPLANDEADALERLREFSRTFNARTDLQSRTLVFVMVPIFALGVALLTVARRRYFADHIVFSTHFFAFMLLAMVALQWGVVGLHSLVAATTGWLGVRSWLADAPLTLTFAALSAVYLTVALRRAYDYGWFGAIAGGLGLVVVFYLTVLVYRSIIFFTTWWSL